MGLGKAGALAVINPPISVEKAGVLTVINPRISVEKAGVGVAECSQSVTCSPGMRAKRPLRIVVLGAPKVGKTALTVRYLTHRFIGEYSSRGDVIYRHNVNIGGEKTEMEILDTCKSSIERREGDGYLVVFSVTEPSSLAAAAGILSGLPSARPVLLLANKTDLDHARCVSVRAGLELSVLAGCPYLEVSAAAGDRCGIALAFGALASRARPQSPLRAAIRALTTLLSARKPPFLCSTTNRIKWK